MAVFHKDLDFGRVGKGSGLTDLPPDIAVTGRSILAAVTGGYGVFSAIATAGGLGGRTVRTGSGLHDVPAGGAVLDRAFAALGFGGAVLGGGHATTSGFLGHNGISLGLDGRVAVSGSIVPVPP